MCPFNPISAYLHNTWGEDESCAQVMNNCPYLSGIINVCKAWITEDQLFSPAGKCG